MNNIDGKLNHLVFQHWMVKRMKKYLSNQFPQFFNMTRDFSSFKKKTVDLKPGESPI